MKGGESFGAPVKAPMVAPETQGKEATAGLASTSQETAVAAGEGNGSQEGWVTPKGVFFYALRHGVKLAEIADGR